MKNTLDIQDDGNLSTPRPGYLRLRNVGGSLKTLDANGEEAALVSGDGSGISDAAAFREALSISSDSAVFVDPSGTDNDRGAALLAAYAAAKISTPGGAALSSSNRATVILTTGVFNVGESLILDTDYVDVISLYPGVPPDISEVEKNPDFGGVNDTYKPTPTQITATSASVTPLKQSARDVILKGVTVAQLATAPSVGVNVFELSPLNTDANDRSVYQDCYFYIKTPSDAGLQPQYSTGNCSVISSGSIDGLWRNCTANISAWRVHASSEFRGQWDNVVAGPYSFMGDAVGASMVAVKMRNCRVKGTWLYSAAGFGGCETFAGGIDADCVFEDCVSGANSFALSNTCAGSFYRCRSGDRSFGSDVELGGNGMFTGYAEDCTAGANSFGGMATGKITGTLLRCKVTGNTTTLRAQGAKIRDSRITTTTTNIHGITLLDSNTKITNSDLIVLQGGTGIPIYAASAKDVRACHCRMNNADADADGLHANVTNLIGTPLNIIDNDMA